MRASLEANDFRTSQHERRGLVLRKVAIEHRWVRLLRGFLGGGSLHRGDMHPPFLPFPIGPLSQRLLRFLFPRNSLSRFTAARSSEATPFAVSSRSGRTPLVAVFLIVILLHFRSLATCLACSRSALYYYITSIVPAVYPSTIRLPNIQRKWAGRRSKLNNCDGNIWPDYPCQPYAFGLTEKEYEGYLG